MKALELCQSINVVKFICNLEDRTHETILPQLLSLTVYTGDTTISEPEMIKISSKLRENGLEELNLSADLSMIRGRHRLKNTYTLVFKMGGLKGLSV